MRWTKLRFAAVGVLACVPGAVLLAAGMKPALVGFTADQVRFDGTAEGEQPVPLIPKGWRLVSVSNGEQPNGNNLWFQDESGAVHVMSGFTRNMHFFMEFRVHHIDVEK